MMQQWHKDGRAIPCSFEVSWLFSTSVFFSTAWFLTARRLCPGYAFSIPSNTLLDNQLQHIYNVCMNSISFSWDDRKNKANQSKHGVSFEEAQTVFFDETAIECFDPDHSKGEDRYLMSGISYRLGILVVSYTLRKDETEIRIISARKATKKEQKAYTGEIR